MKIKLRSSGRPAKRRGRPQAGKSELDRSRILTEAHVILEKEGSTAVTMRRLATRLGVSPMALYNHVAGKNDLLQGVAEKFVEGANFDERDCTWQERIRHCFRELRRVCSANPEAARLLERMASPPDKAFRPMEVTLKALDEIGLRGNDALRAFYLLINFTLGQSFYEAGPPAKGLDPRLRLTSRRNRARSKPPEWNFDRAFEFGLATIIEGLSRRDRKKH